MTSTSDYTGLITSEHAARPKFAATVAAATSGLVDLQNFLGALVTEFDVDSARWKQLDLIGQRVGLDRSLRATAPGIFTQAPPSGSIPLSDADYRVLLRGKIGANQWDGTIAGAYQYLRGALGAGSGLFIIDNQDMSIVICVSGAVPSTGFKAALSGGYMQVRPGGVSASYLFPTAPGGPLFGLDIDNEFIGGLDHGVWSSPT